MTGGVRLVFPAMTINQAVMIATERWRILVEDPAATLPWSTHLEFYEDGADGASGEGDLQSMVRVQIDLDRQVVDMLTGAASAA